MITAPFPQNHLGRTQVKVSTYGYGAASIGNLYNEVSDAQAAETVEAAWSAGIRYFDTAPYYGFGLSERRLGDHLRNKAGFTISTKVGRLLLPDEKIDTSTLRHGFKSPMRFSPQYDYSYDGMMRSFEDSLQRLGLAKVDILYVHDIGRLTHGDEHDRHWRDLFSSGYRALDELRATGSVGAIGLGVNEVEACIEALDEGRFDVFLLAGRYTLLEQSALDVLLPRCVSAGTSLVVGGAFNSGILATGVKRGGLVHYNYEPAPPHIIERVSKIESLCETFSVLLPAAALQFAGAHPAVKSVIAGIGSPGRIQSMIDNAATPIPDEFWNALKSEGLLRSDAPTPGALDAVAIPKVRS